MKFEIALVGGLWGERRHIFEEADGSKRTCRGLHYCRECDREMKEPYMAEDTKKRLRAVLREHMGAAADSLGDQEDLTPHSGQIEWVNLTIALETEFDLFLSEFVMERMLTIDQIARFIDTVDASQHASPH